WWEAVDYCANKERIPGIPWAWRLPLITELKYISYGRTDIHFKTVYNEYVDNSAVACYSPFTGNVVTYPNLIYIWSGSLYGTGGAANGTVRAAAVRGGNASQYNQSAYDPLSVVCILDKVYYPDTDIVPDAGEFAGAGEIIYTDDPTDYSFQ
ncbi:MAG: hypothetical protein SNH63_07380, partial [Rikenellaceae bacterium]